jgi:hypothetical protein
MGPLRTDTDIINATVIKPELRRSLTFLGKYR